MVHLQEHMCELGVDLNRAGKGGEEESDTSTANAKPLISLQLFRMLASNNCRVPSLMCLYAHAYICPFWRQTSGEYSFSPFCSMQKDENITVKL